MSYYHWSAGAAVLLLAHHLVYGLQPNPATSTATFTVPATKAVVPERAAPVRKSAPLVQDACIAARPSIVTLFSDAKVGTGSIITSTGLVLTNEHVVRRQSSDLELSVYRWGGRLYAGKVVALDAVHDLALVQLNTHETLPTIAFAPAVPTPLGQPVCVLGSPRAITGVLARGTLLRARGQDWQSAIRLQPGSSGGPLLNAEGQILGIHKTILMTDGLNANIAFATQAAVVQAFVAKWQQAAKSVTFSKPPSIKRSIPPFLPSSIVLGALFGSALIVELVVPDSPAERAGLNAGDRVLAVDGQPCTQVAGLQMKLRQQPSSVVLQVKRQAKRLTLTVTLSGLE